MAVLLLQGSEPRALSGARPGCSKGGYVGDGGQLAGTVHATPRHRSMVHTAYVFLPLVTCLATSLTSPCAALGCHWKPGCSRWKEGHALMVLSSEAVSRRRPSGEKRTHCTPPAWPLNTVHLACLHQRHAL